jgi:Zn-dependent M28 family amino/carboxypeptidase
LFLLTACPGTKKASSTSFAAPSSILDSASLIRHLAFLTSREAAGRETATPGNQLAQGYIFHQFDSLQLVKPGDSYLQPFKLGNDTGKTGHNVMGIIRGSKYPDSYIAITAHYDHLGIRDGVIYYGADDNASGSANLLTLMEYFKKNQPKHSLLFVAFDAEEKGLLGSRYFVDNLPVPPSSILMDVNMDMISRNDKNEIYATGIFPYPFLKKYVDTAQLLSPVNIRFGHDDPSKGGQQDWTTQSDHYPFHQKKIPFLYFGVEDHADYHKPSDTFDKIDKSFYYQVSSMIANTILVIDRQEKLQ